MRGVSILGSTGSIGQQALRIVRLHPSLFRILALAAGGNIDLLEQQVREFAPSLVSCGGPKAADELRQRLGNCDRPVWIGHSVEGLERVASAEDAQIVVAALPGSTGLIPTFAAVNAGKDVALATKEVLVMAGDLFMRTVADKSVKLLPVDS
jgi:1-deoxy-D-xylulose-5-phosphate reductoisomerase